MGDRVSNPFRSVEWAQDAYQNAGYMSATMGYDWDGDKGEMTVQPRAWHKSPPLRGSPGDVLSSEVFREDIGPQIEEESDRLNLAWLLGYMQCQLDTIVASKSNTDNVNEPKGVE